MDGKYPLFGDFEKTVYEKPYVTRRIRDRVSSILKLKVYWISAYGKASLKPEIHIHYLKNPDRLDVTLICVCMISQKTIQLVPNFEIIDISALRVKTIKLVINIHNFENRQLLDSTTAFHLFRPLRP